LTEELWTRSASAGAPRSNMLISEQWPAANLDWSDESADAEMEWVIGLISEVRSVRSEMNVPGGAKTPLLIKGANDEVKRRLATHENLLKTLGRFDSIDLTEDIPKGTIQIVLDDVLVLLPLADVIDLDQEKSRLTKEIGKAEGEIKKLSGKLGNEQFRAKAPEHVIVEQEQRLKDAQDFVSKLKEAMIRLKDLA